MPKTLGIRNFVIEINEMRSMANDGEIITKTDVVGEHTKLNILYEHRVVSFQISEDKTTLTIFEECDEAFWVSMNKTEALDFLKELTNLINTMKRETGGKGK